MKTFVILALALVSVNAVRNFEKFDKFHPNQNLILQFSIPDKYAHYKPGYMRIPGWQKIQSGQKKLNQKEPTMKFTPRADKEVKGTFKPF